MYNVGVIIFISEMSTLRPERLIILPQISQLAGRQSSQVSHKICLIPSLPKSILPGPATCHLIMVNGFYAISCPSEFL